MRVFRSFTFLLLSLLELVGCASEASSGNGSGGTGAASGGGQSFGGRSDGTSGAGSGGASGGSLDSSGGAVEIGNGGSAMTNGGALGEGGTRVSQGGRSSGAGGAAPTGGSETSRGGAASGGFAGAGTSGASGSAGTSSDALIRNDVFWKDTSGTPIYSQGGGVLKVGDTYYWYGVKYNGAVSYAANPKLNSDTSFNAVTCYSSKDLMTWKFEANVLTAAGSGTEIAGSSWIGRLGVAYNSNTKKYVLVSQYQGTAGSGELFATSSTPNGSFVFDHIQASVPNVANTTTGDQTVFVDDDGKAYVICSSSSGRSNLYVAPLRETDFLAVGSATRIFGGVGREGNAMFKYDGHYYFCSSDLHGWNASHTYCISATNILGPYGAEFVMANTDADFSHVTQTGFFITVNGSSQSTVIFAGDRWSDFAGNGIGYNQWCPLTFSGTTPEFQSLSEWSLNAATGAWSVGPNNNYALNPGFEADRVAVTEPAGWVTTNSANASGGHTGRWAWVLSGDASVEQLVAHLPNGTYTLSAWVKSSGGQSLADIHAKDFGGTEKTLSINTAASAWTQKSISGIAVSNGQCRIGSTTSSSSSQSASLDDFQLIRTGP